MLVRMLPYLAVLALGLFELTAWLRKQAILGRIARWRPPSNWPLAPGNNESGIYRNPRIVKIARRLRTRELVDSNEIDMPKTVSATVGALGFVRFAYRPATKRPEYLALIERQSPRDHLARLFVDLMEALQREGILVAEYFYDRNPQVCHSAIDNSAVFLDDLASRYREYRLMIFGDGCEFSNPYVTEPSRTLATIASFERRVLLSPALVVVPESRRTGVQGILAVLPAGMDGLEQLSSLWNKGAARSPAGSPRVLEKPPEWSELRFREHSDVYVEGVRNYLGADAFQWLCACALHTRLDWELTLNLGAMLLGSSATEDDAIALRLFRLNWFRSGAMPVVLREVLVRQLDGKTEKQARRVILEYLEKHPAPARSYAELVQKGEAAAQRWELRPLDTQRILESRDLTRLLAESGGPRISGIIPRKVRRWIFSNSIPGFGMRPGLRAGLAACSFFMVIFGIAMWAPIPPIREWTQYTIVLRRPQAFAMSTCEAGGLYPAHPPRFRTATGFFESGLEYFNDYNYECAVQAFSDAIRLNHNNSEAYSKRAACYIGLDRLAGKDGEGAMADLQMAIRLDPKNQHAYYNLSVIYAKRGDYERALSLSQKASEIDPADWFPHNETGSIYSDTDRLEDALREYDKAIRLDPKAASPHNNKAVVFKKRNQIDSALAEYRIALSLDPYLTIAQVNIGDILAERKDYATAIAEYTSAIDKNRRSRWAYKRRAYAYEAIDEYGKALEDINQLLRFAPDADAYLDRGNIYARRSQNERAIQDYTAAIALRGSYEVPYYNRGLQYDILGRKSEAMADFQMVLNLSGPDDHKEYARTALLRLKAK